MSVRAAIVVGVVALATARVASADSAGVVVSGDPVLQGPVASRLESWLRNHGFALVASPLDSDGFNTIGNCLLLDDLDCARGVIESRASADAVAYVRIDTTDAEVALTAWWFVKGHEPTHDHAGCASCAGEGWHGPMDQLMVSITGANAKLGHLIVRSRPAGVAAKIDGKPVGPTPVERDLSSGDHVVVLERNGKRIARKTVTLGGGETASLDIPVKAAPEPAAASETDDSSNAGPIVAIVAGAAGMAGGGVAIYLGHKTDGNYDFPHATAIGVGLIGAGLVSVIVGGVVLDRAAPRPHPVVSITRGGALVGWSTAF